MTEPETKTERQAHSDRSTLISELVAAKKAILGAVVTGMCAGVVVLIASYFELKSQGKEMGELKDTMREVKTELKSVTERTSIMWYRGGWAGDNETRADRNNEMRKQENQ